MSHKLTVNEAITIREILNLFAKLGGISTNCNALANNIRYLGEAITVGKVNGKKQHYLCVPLKLKVTSSEMLTLLSVIPPNSEIEYGEVIYDEAYLRIPVASDATGAVRLEDLTALRDSQAIKLARATGDINVMALSETDPKTLRNALVALNNSAN